MDQAGNGKTGIVFFCHGARDPKWREPFDAILAQVKTDRPDQVVTLAFLELMTPGFEQALESIVAQVVNAVKIVPLFLAPGKHTRKDMPQLIDQARIHWPDVAFSVVPTLTEIPAVRAAIIDWACQPEAEPVTNELTP